MVSCWARCLSRALLLLGPAGAAGSVFDTVAAGSGQAPSPFDGAPNATVANMSDAAGWTTTPPYDAPDLTAADVPDASAAGASSGTGLANLTDTGSRAEGGAPASLLAVAGGGGSFYARVCAAVNCRSGLPLSSAHNFGEAAVGKAGGHCVAAFRGTGNLRDAVQDLESFSLVGLPGCPGCRVGSGFLSGWRSVAGPVKGALRRLGCRSVAVTGHSLGAARAVLAAYDLARDGFRITTSYVFGEPRVGNGAFLSAFRRTVHAQVFRVVHGRDPVAGTGNHGAHCVGSEIYEPGNSVLTDHLHYSGVAMTPCMPDGVPGGARWEREGEHAGRTFECCARFEWSCCRHR